jgi:hypothetical protein
MQGTALDSGELTENKPKVLCALGNFNPLRVLVGKLLSLRIELVNKASKH